jgi:hypothetical protein
MSCRKHAELVVFIAGEARCADCGHRVTWNGVVPLATRRKPPWRWPAELARRRRARRSF